MSLIVQLFNFSMRASVMDNKAVVICKSTPAFYGIFKRILTHNRYALYSSGIIGLPINGNSTINAMNLRSSGQKKIRHRRIGSADLTFNLPPMPIDRRTLSETKQVKMEHTETQTDTMDLSADTSICSLAMPRDLVAPVSNLRSQRHSSTESLAANDNGNRTTDTDTVDHAELCSKSNEQLAYDYMNSNEQLDIRESSDDDNLETLDRRVSQFFTENRLVNADNGNGGSTTIDSRALFNVMASRRSLIIGDKDQVTVISRNNTYKSTTNVYMCTTRQRTVAAEEASKITIALVTSNRRIL